MTIYRLGTSNDSTTATRVAVLHTAPQNVCPPGSDLATSRFKHSLPHGRVSVLTGMFSP